MSGVLTDDMARVARIGGLMGMAASPVLFALALQADAEWGRLYAEPFLHLLTFAAVYAAGRWRQRRLEVLAPALFAATQLFIGLPDLAALFNEPASVARFAQGVLHCFFALPALGLAAAVFFEMEHRFTGSNA